MPYLVPLANDAYSRLHAEQRSEVLLVSEIERVVSRAGSDQCQGTAVRFDVLGAATLSMKLRDKFVGRANPKKPVSALWIMV